MVLVTSYRINLRIACQVNILSASPLKGVSKECRSGQFKYGSFDSPRLLTSKKTAFNLE